MRWVGGLRASATLCLALSCLRCCSAQTLPSARGEDGNATAAPAVSHSAAPFEDVATDGREVGPDLCPRGIGAAVEWPNVIQHFRGEQPRVYLFAIPVTLLGALATIAIFLLHLPTLPTCEWAKIHMIAAVPTVIACCKLVAVWAPRLWKLLFFLASVYEILVFWMFLGLIVGLVGRNADEAIKTLEDEPPMKVWAVVPFGCCFKPCVTPRHFTRWDLSVINVLVRQFMVVLPVVSALEMSEMVPEPVHKSLSRLEVLSLMTAMFGLFALLQATHGPLHDRRCHAKFWTIKGMFIANTAIFRAFSAAVHNDVRIGTSYGVKCYTSETIASAWASMVIVVCSVPLAMLSCYAYSAEDAVDLQELSDEKSSDDSTDCVE